MLVATLITPLMIATAPIAITVPPRSAYSHERQMSEWSGDLAQNTTWNGTRTYTFDGRPFDNDND